MVSLSHLVYERLQLTHHFQPERFLHHFLILLLEVIGFSMAYVGEHLMETLNLVLKTLRLTQLEMIEDRQVVGVDGNPFRPRDGGDRLLLFLIFQFQLLEFSLCVSLFLLLHYIGIALRYSCGSLAFLRSVLDFHCLIGRH